MTGELTPTLKLRRNHVMEKYKGMIEELFEGNSFKDKKPKNDSLMNNSTTEDANG
jgi:hypothetical protein